MKNFTSRLVKQFIASFLLVIIFCALSVFVSAQVTNTTHPANSPYASIQAAINDPLTTNGDIITVAPGVYHEDILLNKRLILRGAMAGIDARNRVLTLVPNSAVESLISPLTTGIRLQAGSSGSEIDGFAVYAGHAPDGAISNVGAPALSDISIRNNSITTAIEGSAIGMSTDILNLTIENNEMLGGPSGLPGHTIHLGTGLFYGFRLSNNNIKGRNVVGGIGSDYGLYVDGNRNLGTNASRSSIINGNLFKDFSTLCIYAGIRSFDNVLIAENTFNGTGSSGNGFYGGTRNCIFEKNTFTGYHNYGLWLTGGEVTPVPTDLTRGASGTIVRNNFFSNNGSTVTSSQSSPAGDIAFANQAPGMQASNIITENSLLSPISISDYERQGTQDPINAPCNWYGTIDPAAISVKIIRFPGAVVNYQPYLSNGTDNDLVASGFQPIPGSCNLPDITPPIITCPGDVNRQCNEDISPASIGTATAADNNTPANAILITYTDNNTQSPDPMNHDHYNYYIYRNWKATDLAGNFSECIQAIWVYDPFPVEMVCPANLYTATAPDQCGTMVNIPVPTAVSTCVPSPYITITNDYNNTNNASGFYPVGTTLVTWTARSPTRTTVCLQYITVFDSNPPVITCPDDISVDATSAAGAIVNYDTPIGTDNCSGAVTVPAGGLPSGSTFPIGTTTVSYRVKDAAGLQGTCSFNITVNAGTPEITCPGDISVNSDPGQCGARVSFAATATAGATITYLPEPGSLFPVGTTTVIATATNFGGSISCSFNVTVHDITAPMITCPANVTIACDANTSAEATGTATAIDDCTASNLISLTYQDASTQVSAVNNAGHYNYIITRTWKATDIAGNFIQCVQTITVHDVTVPEITCPGDVTINFNADTSPTGTGTATASDNCTPLNLIVVTHTDVSTQDPSPNSPSHINYIISRTWRATDVSGNFNECVQTITVHDVTPPVITCPANISISNLPGLCQATVIVPPPTVTDNVSTLELGNGLNFDGINDVALVAASSPINAVTQSKRTVEVYFRVNDKSINTRKQVIWEEGGNSNGLNIYVFNNRLYYGVYSLGQGWGGTWLSTPNIQSGQWHNAVLVYDGTITTGRLKAYLDGVLVASADASATLGSAIMNHPNANAVGALSENGIFHDGVQLLSLGHFFGGDIDEIRLWTIARTAAELQATNTVQLHGNEPGLVVYYNFDQGIACGNNSTVTTLVDRTVTHLNGTMQGFALTGGCTSNWTHGSPALNSSITLTNSNTHTADASSTYPVGTTNVVWTATDAAGNSASCMQTITVTDNQAPVAICKPATVYLDANGRASVSATDINNGSNDVCGPVILSIGGTTGTMCATADEGFDLTMTAPPGAVFTGISFASYGTPGGECGSFTVSDCNAINSRSILETYALGHNSFTLNANNLIFGDPCPNTYKRLYVQAQYSGTHIFDCSNRGVNEVTLYVTDLSGNTSTCTSVVTVVDSVPPAIQCPADISINATSAAGAIVNYSTPVGTDNCFGPTTILTSGFASGATFPIGVTAVTHKVTDGSGLTAICSFTVTVTGLAPQIICPQNIIVSNTAGQCGANVSFAATETVAIPASVITYSHAPGSFFPVGTTTVTATATNAVGVSACNFMITVNDTEHPIIICPANINVNNDEGKCGATIIITSATATDNCQVQAVEGVRSDALELTADYPVGTTTITWTATGIHGLTATCTQNVIVTDIEHPVITCAANINVNNDNGKCGATLTIAPATATDNCQVQNVVGVRSDALELTADYPVGTIVITWTATDIHGLTTACTQTVIITDNEHPVIACPANINVDNDNGKCGATPTITPATTTDNCQVQNVVGVRSDGLLLTADYPVGATTITWTATDIHELTSTCTQTITVTDTEHPVINNCPANISVSTGPSRTSCDQAVNWTAPTATDNCGNVTVSSNHSPSDLFPVGTTMVTYTFTDIHDNSSSCSFNVTVSDNTPPVITCPANVILNCQDNTASTITGLATATDNCSPVTITQSETSTQTITGSAHYNYVITRTWKAMDQSGNISTCVQTITVRDITPPLITCPANVTINCQDNNTSSAIGAATATDNCSAVVIMQSQTSTQTVSGPGLYNYVITRTWKATDESGNFSTCVQTITVRDITAPTINCPANKTLHCQDNNTSSSTGVATGADMCSPVTITQTQTSTQTASGAGLYNYVIARTWKATDVTGNSSTSVQTITVRDITAPTIVCPANVTRNCQDNNTSSSTGVATGTDICSPVTITQTQTSTQTTSGAGLYNYVITRTWKATDVTGNFSTSVQTITVRDLTPPVISCVANQTRATNAGLCTYKVQGNEFNPTATDNCAVPLLTYVLGGATTGSGSTTLTGVNFQKGTTTVTWTAKDVSANQSVCSFTVTINDDQNATNYLIYANTQANFGINNHINGDVGVTASNGEALFTIGDVLDPYTVKAKNIVTLLCNAVNHKVFSPATGGPNPPFQIYNGNTTGLGNYTISSNMTLAGNYKNLTIKSGVTATLQGNNFGTVIIEQGAKVTFTATTINMEQLFVGSGLCSMMTYVYFSNPASLRVRDMVTILQNCRVNVGGPKVTCYVGDTNNDEEHFYVLGGNTRVTLNIMIPNGELNVTSIFGSDIMTGWYIVERLESLGFDVTWNKYDCSPVTPQQAGRGVEQPAMADTNEQPMLPPASPVVTAVDDFKVKVYPNPSTTEFNLQVLSSSNEPISVRLMDANGSVLKTNTTIVKGSSIKLGSELRGGTYFAEVIQGQHHQTVKLVKLN